MTVTTAADSTPYFSENTMKYQALVSLKKKSGCHLQFFVYDIFHYFSQDIVLVISVVN